MPAPSPALSVPRGAIRPVLGIRATEGIVTAIVAVTGCVDEVQDLIVPRAFMETLAQRRPKVVHHHDWKLDTGRVLHIEEWMPGDRRLPARGPGGRPWPPQAGALVAVMQFNLAIQRGREAFETAKFYAASGESCWSIGYKVVPERTSKRADGVRVIRQLHLYEISDVVHGAHPLTMALEVKAAGDRQGIETKATRLRPGAEPNAGHGAMVALFPPEEVAKAIEHPDGSPASELHVTLAYLGDSGDVQVPIDRLATALRGVGDGNLSGRIGGIGMFPPPEPPRFFTVEEARAAGEALRREFRCPACRGTGVDDEGGDCQTCDGTGGPTDEVLDVVESAPKGGPSVAGVCVLAADTGRVLMLQRALNPTVCPCGMPVAWDDTDGWQHSDGSVSHDGEHRGKSVSDLVGTDHDPAAGMWEFPGGHADDGEAPWDAGAREWAEEVGRALPAGRRAGHWDASNGIYRGHVLLVPTEASVAINLDAEDRPVTNPDDPDGDGIETVAWWDPEHLAGNPAVRAELAEDLDRVLAAIRAAGKTDGTEAARCPVWVPVDVPGLVELRQRVTDALMRAGAPPKPGHGFVPHLTLGYGLTDVAPVPSTPVAFDAVWLVLGGKRVRIPLTPPFPVQVKSAAHLVMEAKSMHSGSAGAVTVPALTPAKRVRRRSGCGGTAAKGLLASARLGLAGKGGGMDRNRGGAEHLRRWFVTGPGAALIGWGTPGDHARCVAIAGRHMTTEQAHGYCQLREHEATGEYTAEHAARERAAGHKDGQETKAMTTMAGSYEELGEQLRDAARTLLFPVAERENADECPWVNIEATFPDHMFVRTSVDGEETTLHIPYTVDAGAVSLGEPRPVELTVIAVEDATVSEVSEDVAQAARFVAPAAAAIQGAVAAIQGAAAVEGKALAERVRGPVLALLDTLAVKGVDVAGMVLGDEDDSDEEIPEAPPEDDAPPPPYAPAADGGTGPGDAVPPATGTGDEEEGTVVLDRDQVEQEIAALRA